MYRYRDSNPDPQADCTSNSSLYQFGYSGICTEGGIRTHMDFSSSLLRRAPQDQSGCFRIIVLRVGVAPTPSTEEGQGLSLLCLTIAPTEGITPLCIRHISFSCSYVFSVYFQICAPDGDRTRNDIMSRPRS